MLDLISLTMGRTLTTSPTGVLVVVTANSGDLWLIGLEQHPHRASVVVVLLLLVGAAGGFAPGMMCCEVTVLMG